MEGNKEWKSLNKKNPPFSAVEQIVPNDQRQTISIAEALELMKQRDAEETQKKEQQFVEQQERYLEYQIKELIAAYRAKDWRTCLELIVQRMGGFVFQPEWD